MDIDSVTLSRWERGKHHPPSSALLVAAKLYQKPLSYFGAEAERLGETVPRGTAEQGWAPNPALARVLPGRVYEVALSYCRRLAAAGLPREEVEEAERLLIDEGYAKLNRRAKRAPSEDEQIQILDVTWQIMQEVLSWKGVRA